VASVLSQIDDVAERPFILEAEKRDLCIRAWSSAVESLTDHAVPSEEVEERLIKLKNGLSLSTQDCERAGSWLRLVKSAVLRDLVNGAVPQRVSLALGLPFDFQKGEQLVWLFERCDLLQDKTVRQYVGGSRGVSVRIAKGVYYHASGFKGRRIDRTQRAHVDTGMFAVTTKQMYFSGPKKAFRVPYTKIVAFEPFTDGLGIVRDAASAKPQFFITNDGWFSYNLVANLARLT
jgi:hypothetical protein